MRFFKIAACAAVVGVSISSGAAQVATRTQPRSHSSQIHHYKPSEGLSSKGLPRSSVPGGSSTIGNFCENLKGAARSGAQRADPKRDESDQNMRSNLHPNATGTVNQDIGSQDRGFQISVTDLDGDCLLEPPVPALQTSEIHVWE